MRCIAMARIRTVKPEFWTSEQIAECSPTARLLFIGIWSFSDDHGIHPASVKRLKMEVFPSDVISDEDIQAMVDELEAAELLHSYQVAGKDYWQVTGWARHQKIDKPTYRHPQPGAPVGESAPAVHAPSPDVNSASAPREVGEASPSPRVRSLKESKGSKALSGSPDCLAILSHLNERAGRNYSPVRASLDLIGARLKEGATVAQCCAVVDAKVTEWATDPTMQKYLRPETLFNATKFAGYAGQLADATCVKDWE
ncbi:hypothetical protein F2P45_32245 [Massilia sp. CCM 8733]|uniref:Phage conserved hypothetical protein C-terminal domain-containing protein n=2 Tax=Massilia mucilaginosa TaxID=2609282 RepID=A0ABX0P495_9BURK|nr:hypothetical protein [Massilia mucilaginosa]